MKKPQPLIVVIIITLVVLAYACNFADRLMDAVAEIGPSETPTTNTPTESLTDTPTLEPTETPLPTPTETPTITPTPEPVYDIGSTMVNPVDGAVLVYVPEGEFLMGSEDEDQREDEGPEHLVFLDAFWLYQTPVTNAQFAAFIDASGHQTTAEEDEWSWVVGGRHYVQRDGAYWAAPEGPGSSLADRGDHPVVQVSWFDAAAYCEWTGGRLPTEAEWEKAARGTDGRRFPWGNEPVTGERANYCDVNCTMDWADKSQDDGYERTSPVGSYPMGASPYGALDMAGNVWEWVADWYAEDYYTLSPDENPTGPTSGEFRVLRGGSWRDDVRFVRVSRRYWSHPDFRDYFNGFRCLLREAP